MIFGEGIDTRPKRNHRSALVPFQRASGTDHFIFEGGGMGWASTKKKIPAFPEEIKIVYRGTKQRNILQAIEM